MDPTILKPPSRFALPAQRGVSRSPSRSPIRNQHVVSRGLEPLLSDLSPTSTLKALQSADTAEAPASPNASLIDSAISASTSERAWGIKAALAGKKVRDWYKELEAWPWPSAAHDGRNGFEPLAGALQEGREETAEGGPEELQYGSLPAWTAQEYEQRIEEIRDDLETLELEELKAHVRAMHLSTDPRRSTYGQFDAGLINGYAQLDDFTAIMTSTIMQTLPDVSRLNALLGIWSIRLVVSRQVPGFLDCIEETQTAMDSAWKAVGEPRNEGPRSESDINREAFMTMRGVLEKQIHELGQRLDSMLDALEGREDTVPEPWIDRMEAVEADFETWAVQTEQRVLEGELLAARARPRSPATPARRHSDEDGEISSHLRNMLSSREASAEKTHARVYSLGNNTFEPHSKPRPLGLNLSRPQTPVEGPINSDFSSDYSYPGSATSGSFSNMSSPEIQQASRAEYFGAPVEITSPNLVQKDPMSPSDTISRQSSQRTERGNPDTDDIASGTRSRASSFMPEPAILEDGPPVESRPSDIEQSMFRHFAELNDQGSPTHDQPKSSSNDEPSMVGREHAETMYGTPLKRTKPRNKFEDAAVVAPGATPVRIRQRRLSDPTSPPMPKYAQASPMKGAEQLEARISSILTEIPAHIRLTSGPEEDAEEVLQPGFGTPNSNTATRQLPPRFNRSQTSVPSPSMTLAPAQAKNSKTRIGGDPEIKLYHLHQAGKDAPIKLFVRLVGEAGERVMVRIGGGWADLGEYLKEYASHHGKRSVSDSRYAFQELPSTPVTSSPVPAGLSAPNSRPTSSSGLDASTLPMTPEQAAQRFLEAMPGSLPSAATLRPGSRHSTSEEDSPLGGAGPKTKQSEISPSKQAWVDGMLDQARKAGVEKNRGHASEVGALGKVGGTKRVFLRSKTTG